MTQLCPWGPEPKTKGIPLTPTTRILPFYDIPVTVTTEQGNQFKVYNGYTYLCTSTVDKTRLIKFHRRRVISGSQLMFIWVKLKVKLPVVYGHEGARDPTILSYYIPEVRVQSKSNLPLCAFVFTSPVCLTGISERNPSKYPTILSRVVPLPHRGTATITSYTGRSFCLR